LNANLDSSLLKHSHSGVSKREERNKKHKGKGKENFSSYKFETNSITSQMSSTLYKIDNNNNSIKMILFFSTIAFDL